MNWTEQETVQNTKQYTKAVITLSRKAEIIFHYTTKNRNTEMTNVFFLFFIL